MRALTGVVLTLFLCVQASSADAQSASSTEGIRFGYISRYNRGMQPEPIVDRYVGNIRARIARAAGVIAVDLPGTPLEPDDYRRFCKTLHLRGFIEAAVGYRTNALAVSGSGIAVVTDCDGQVVFAPGAYCCGSFSSRWGSRSRPSRSTSASPRRVYLRSFRVNGR
jgi:hypothetical protein